MAITNTALHQAELDDPDGKTYARQRFTGLRLQLIFRHLFFSEKGDSFICFQGLKSCRVMFVRPVIVVRKTAMNSKVACLLIAVILLMSAEADAKQIQLPAASKPAVASLPQASRQLKTRFHRESDALLKLAKTVTSKIAKSTVLIQSGERQIALGLIVSSDGHILTKASRLRQDSSVAIGGKAYPFQIVGIHKKTDLAMLKIDARDLPAAELIQTDDPNLGNWLFSPGPENESLAVGVFAGPQRKGKVFLGVQLAPVRNNQENEPQGVRIQQIVPRSPAQQAGLLVNDIIMSIKGEDDTFNSVVELQSALAGKKPYESIELLIVRGDDEVTVRVELVQRTTFTGARGQLLTSKGRTGRSFFSPALLHDSNLVSKQCGGPVLDLSGQVVGINILGPLRVSPYLNDPGNRGLVQAIPINEVMSVIDLLKTGDLAPKKVNKNRIEMLQRQLAETDEFLGTDVLDQISELETTIRKIDDISRTLPNLKRQLADLKKRMKDAQQQQKQIQQELKELRSGQEY